MARLNSLLIHPNLNAINAALLAGEPVAAIAQKHHVSVATLYRYRSSSVSRISLEAAKNDTASVADIVGTLTASLRDADTVRRAALSQGRTSEALRAAQIVNQVSATLATRLGIDSTETAAALAQGEKVTDALVALIRETPDLASRMANELETRDERELAHEFTSVHTMLAEKKTA